MCNPNQSQFTSVVYIPVRYGQILGVYASQDDAMQIVSGSVLKGNPCNLIIRSIIPNSQLK